MNLANPKYVSMFFLIATIVISLALSSISYLKNTSSATFPLTNEVPIPFPITESFDASLEQRDLTMYDHNVPNIQSDDGVSTELSLSNAHPIETHINEEVTDHHNSYMGTPVKNTISAPIQAEHKYSFGKIFDSLFSLQDGTEQFDIISNF